MDEHVRLFKNLFTAINSFFDHPEMTDASIDDLRKIFYIRLTEMLELSFDAQLSVNNLKRLVEVNGEHINKITLTKFFVSTVENEKSYIILNYYSCRYLQSCFNIIREDKKEEFDMLLIKHGVKAEELKLTHDHYRGMIFSYKTLPPKI